ncbi:hypothetical protein Tco_0969254 [Tanacetum coccineum]
MWEDKDLTVVSDSKIMLYGGHRKFCKKNDVKARSLCSWHAQCSSTYLDPGASSTNNINTVNPEVSTGSQLVHEDLEQLHDDDLEEMDLKVNVSTAIKWDIFAMNAEQQGVRHRNLNQALKKQYDDLLVKLDDTGFKASTYKRGLSILEGQILKYKESEVLFLRKLLCLKVDWVSDDEDDVEPIPKVEKKTVIPTATKKEFVKPEKPVRRSVSCPNVNKHMAPRAVLMKTGLKLLILQGLLTMLVVASRHMTGNIAHLLDFKDFGMGFVTFGGGAYGGRITGTGTIKTGNLDFDDVYFVKELKFNLFSVSQIVQDAYILWMLSPKIVDDAQIEDTDELHDEDDATEESHDGSSLKENGTADQQVNTARPDINTGSREVSTALP